MCNSNTAEVLERGMSCLLDQLGVVETERFISIIIRERFDYTKWRKDFFSDASVEDINRAAVAYAEKDTFHPKRTQLVL